MKGSRYIFKSYDDRDISVIKWIPEDGIEVIGAVQISHGMAEHIARYEDFALFLNKNGFIVIGNDHRGHGKSLLKDGDTGIFSEKDGWDKTLDDLRTVTLQIREQHKDIPVFMIAHSMGSFLGRNYIARWGDDLRGIIISGTGNQNMLTIKLFKFLVAIELLFKGIRHRSKFFDKMSFGSFNKPFEPSPTPFEWLSRDREQVDKYNNDPLGGFICTTAHFRDLSQGLNRVCSKKIYSKVSSDLPILLYSGENDPVGGKKCSLVKEVFNNYKAAGIKDVTMEINKDGRHESLNETNRLEVYETFLKWIKNHL